MGPKYRLLLPEHPPDGRDHWVMPDQVFRTEDGVPHPWITTRTMTLMFGLTRRETEFVVYHALKNFPEVQRGRGTERVFDLHTLERLLDFLFERKRTFRFDRLYLGMIQIRNFAYLYGYIDQNGYKLYPTEATFKKHDYFIPMSNRNKKKLREKN